MIELKVMPDGSEIIPYEDPQLPLQIKTADLSDYPGMSAPCHWHDEFEWVYIQKGCMCYYINGKHVVLKENDSLMVNTRQMHYGYSFRKQDCIFSYILFHPSLFCQNEILQQRFVAPVLKNYGLEYIHFSYNEKEGKDTAEFLIKMIGLKEAARKDCELEIIALMHLLWSRLWQQKLLTGGADGQEIPDDLKIQKDMVSFLYQHYKEKITLDEIAASGNVSRSKCCRIFRHYMQQTPVDFLNAYRLKVSGGLLRATDKSITEIALACGFNHLSYFSKLFLDSYGCTPREYRRAPAAKSGG